MIDTAQGILLFVVVVLTILLVVLGVQVFFILREFRKTVNKANKVLDDTSSITGSVSGPLSSISSFSYLSTGMKIGSALFKFLKNKKNFFRELTDDE